MKKRQIAVAVTGASGSIYAKLLLNTLSKIENLETGLVFSGNSQTVWKEELGKFDLNLNNFKIFENHDYYAPFASGSSNYDTFIICPCSMGTLGRIANGISDSLITRAADVMLKEKRKLICVVREAPYNLIHIQNMEKVIQAGGIILPASPSFYSLPKGIEALCMTVINRITKLADIGENTFSWGENH